MIAVTRVMEVPKRSILTMFDDAKGKGWGPNLSISDCTIEFSNSNQNNSAVISSSGSNNNPSKTNPMYACFLCICNFTRDE